MEQKIDGTTPEATAEKKTEVSNPTTAPDPEKAALLAEVEKLKKSLSKSNSEAAENKRKYLDSLDEAQRKEAERAEKEAAREARIAELEARERVSTYKSKLMDAGFDSTTADLMAQSLPAGVGDEYFAAQKAFNESQRRSAVASAMDNQPGLSVGMPPTSADAKKAEDNKLRGYFGLPPLK